MASKKTYTKTNAYESVARSLRVLGYPDCTPAMIKDTHQAMMRGDTEMPHGIIGMFAEWQIQEVRSQVDALPD